MYTRWEYTDLTHYYSRIVMHMNPDGTENKALYGSGAMFPNSTFDVQPLPGHGSAFVGIISGHHGVARSGRMIIFDPTKGRKSTAGMVQEIPHRNRPNQGPAGKRCMAAVHQTDSAERQILPGCSQVGPACLVGTLSGGRLRQRDLSDAGRRRRLYQPDPGAQDKDSSVHSRPCETE